jgi:hypothetical protein
MYFADPILWSGSEKITSPLSSTLLIRVSAVKGTLLSNWEHLPKKLKDYAITFLVRLSPIATLRQMAEGFIVFEKKLENASMDV